MYPPKDDFVQDDFVPDDFQPDDYLTGAEGIKPVKPYQSGISRFFFGDSPAVQEYDQRELEKRLGLPAAPFASREQKSFLPDINFGAWQPDDMLLQNIRNIGDFVYKGLIQPLGTPEGFLGAASPTDLPLPAPKLLKAAPDIPAPIPRTHFQRNLPPASEATVDRIVAERAAKEKRLGILRKISEEGQTLPPSEHSFVGGEAGNVIDVPYTVQYAGETTPIPVRPEQLASGGIPLTRSVEPVADLLNLDELREAQRLQDLNFGAAEQYPGTRLTIPDESTLSSLPAQSGSTELGFQPQTSGELGYPLNIVPNTLRPRTAQTVTKALTPEAIQNPPVKTTVEGNLYSPYTPVEPQATLTPIFPEKPPDVPWNVDDTIRTMKGSQRPATVQDAYRIERVRPAIDAADKSGNSFLSGVVRTPSFIKKFGDISNQTRNTLAGLYSSIDTELTKLNPMLGNLVKLVQVDSKRLSGKWMVEYDDIVKNVSDKKWSEVVGVLEGKTRSDDPLVNETVRRIKVLDREISDRAVASKMGLKNSDGTKEVPWQPRENYFPHMYTREFFESMTKNPLEFRATLLKQINPNTGKLWSNAEVDALLNNSKKYGERLIDAQHMREADLPGYRTDKEVYRQHINEMGKRIIEAEKYGPMDLADAESPLSILLKQTSNEEYANELMKRVLGREPVSYMKLGSGNMSRALTKAQAWAHLGLAGISNFGSTLMTPMQTNMKSFASGLADLVFNSEEAGEFAMKSGALQNIYTQMIAHAIEGASASPTKTFGLDIGERWMRTISAGAGKAYVKELFNELKRNPQNEGNLLKLKDLLLEEPSKVLAQPSLTTDQIERAAFRTGEMSQGLAEAQNLPYWWTNGALPNMLALFHKYAFAQSKIIKDAVKANPMRAIPYLIAGGAVVGELTGDVKAAVRGTARTLVSPLVGEGKERVSEEVKGRGDYWNKKLGMEEGDLTGRMVEDVAQSFSAGLFIDMLELATGGGGNASKMVLGAMGSDGARILDIFQKIGKGNIYGATADTASFIPVVGTSIRKEMMEQQ